VPTIGKLANIQTDLDYVAPKEEGRLKAFVSGEELEVERKNKDAVTERPTARLTFACNPPPMFRDRSRGIWRRLIYVRFREQISDDEANPDMTEEEWWAKELPGIFNLAVTGLRELLARGRFEEPENCRIDKEEYRQELNPADIFLRDHTQLCPCEKRPCSDPHHAVWTGDLYEAYKEWLRQAGHDHKDQLSKAYFGREVRRVFSVVSLAKYARMHRVFRKQFQAGALVDSEEIEMEVKDRQWEGLLFYPHGIPTAEDKQETNGESRGSE
jgi:phage/plasmid-associated DNA primase